MNKLNKKLLILISIGMFFIGFSQIIGHFFVLPDFMKGGFMGIGIGLMILGLIKNRIQFTS